MIRNKVYDSNVRRFEALLSKHFDDTNVLTVCNATIGIMGVFYSLGLSNAEVITTPLTWEGAFSGLEWINCKLKFGKIEEPSLTLAPRSIASLITSKTKAIFTADVLGYPCRLDEIKEICKQHNLLLIHDAAGSLGSTWNGFYSGKYADVTIYSFGRHKPFTTNEGGCIISESDKLFETIISHLAHPERQGIMSKEINPLALNTSMNSLAVNYGLSHFEYQMDKILYHQNFVRKEMDKLIMNNLYFEYAFPNFYKPFFNTMAIKSHSCDLPFQPLSKEYGIHNQIFKQYKISQNLCLPL